MNPQHVAKLTETYRVMAELGYHPGAPSDGYGNITASDAERNPPEEWSRCAVRFLEADEDCQHWVGCGDYSTIQILPYLIESATLLNAGDDGNPIALKLLRQAVAELAAIYEPATPQP